jgi:hypothetical protein
LKQKPFSSQLKTKIKSNAFYKNYHDCAGVMFKISGILQIFGSRGPTGQRFAGICLNFALYAIIQADFSGFETKTV